MFENYREGEREIRDVRLDLCPGKVGDITLLSYYVSFPSVVSTFPNVVNRHRCRSLFGLFFMFLREMRHYHGAFLTGEGERKE